MGVSERWCAVNKILPLIFAAVLLTAALCGCAEKAAPQTTTLNAVTAEEELAERFNAALALLENVGSYAVRGSVISSAEVIPADGSSGESAILNVPFEMAVSADSFSVRSESGDLPHSTYFDGEHYYVSVEDIDLRYRSKMNDYYDYPATAYFCPINAEAVFSPAITEENGRTELRFRIPFGLYASEALAAWLGDLIDETCASSDIQAALTVASDGLPEKLYLFFSTVTDFSGDSIRQELVVDLTFSEPSTAIVTPPDSLEAYTDRTEAQPGTSEDFLEIPPEDLQ